MPEVVALGAITVDLNISLQDASLHALGLEVGSNLQVGDSRIEEVRLALEKSLSSLPDPVSGGSVANTADLISRSKVETGFIGLGGNDPFGNQFKIDSERAGMQLLYPLQDGLVTGYNLCFSNEKGVSTIFWTAGANNTITPQVVDESVVRASQLIVIDGFTFGLGENGPATVEHTVNLAKKYNVPYIITLASVQIIQNHYELLRDLLVDASFAVGNLSQTAALVKMDQNASMNEILRAARGAMPNILVTLGAQGVYVSCGKEEYIVDGRTVDVKDTTGAGDAFLGGFIVASRRGLSLPASMAVGNYVASEVVQHFGARLSYALNIPDLIERAIGLNAQ